MCSLYNMTATVDELRKVFGDFYGDRHELPSKVKLHNPLHTHAQSSLRVHFGNHCHAVFWGAKMTVCKGGKN